MKLCLIIILIFLPSLAFAQKLENYHDKNINPLRSFKKVHPKGSMEEVNRLKNAEVLIADYELIRKDFPELSKLSNPEIDDWLIEQTAFISKDQSSQEIVNSKILITDETRQALRPPEYGRALVYEVNKENKKIGLIDVKGAGGIEPSFASHKSGTMTLGEALREFSYEKMITNVVKHSAIENKVVGSYGVIYAGFDVIHQDGSKTPAGLYLRQAHRRRTRAENASRGLVQGNGWLDKKWRDRFQQLMNKYGIYADNNYQGTINNNLFDFGHYIIRNDLERADEKILIPFEQWGFDKSEDEAINSVTDRWRFSKRDRPWIWSHETAEAFVKRKASRHDVWMNHYNLLKPVQEKLRKVPRLYKESRKIGFYVNFCNQYLDKWGR